MFVPYVGCTVLVITSNMVHPAKIVTVGRNDAEVRYDLCGRVHSVPYARMIPVLDHHEEENVINSVMYLIVTIHSRNTFIMNQSVSSHIESAPALSSNHFRGMSDVF
jgi:hypothetical protein